MNKKRKIVMSTLLIILFISVSVTSTFASNNYTTLKFGSRGSQVSNLQQALNTKGFWSGSVDGIYGKMTENAVIQFQISSKILIDGIAGRQTQSLLFSSPVSRGSTYSRTTTSDNVYWLSRIINAEAEAEPYSGKVAVGNVILNRVNSNQFPNTIYGVIFEYYKNIPQFSPVADGTIYNNPSAESIQAAKDALNGMRPVGSSTYFFNPEKAAGTWIVQNKVYVKKIGDHVFYK